VIEPSTIGFVTLFLGLTSGSWPVEVMVAPPAVTAELRLDGAAVARLSNPPWSATVDFGPELVPHELTAAALDAEGHVISQATQWVNMPQPQTRVDVVLEQDAGGQVGTARVGWAAKQGRQPTGLEADLDGSRLPVDSSKLALGVVATIPLPGVDMSRAHVLRVSVLFKSSGAASREVVFGGSVGMATSAELTAVPALVRDGQENVSVEQLQGMLLLGGQPARVVAVEKGPVTIAVVVEPSAFASLNTAGVRWAKATYSTRGSARASVADRLILVDPRPSTAPGPSRVQAEVFPARVFRDFDPPTLPAVVAVVPLMRGQKAAPRLADAGAIAGVIAAGGQGRRAVVLVLQDEPELRELKRSCTLLSALGVPLHVWWMGKKPLGLTEERCGVWWDLSKGKDGVVPRLTQANTALQAELGRQVIVWIEGTHRPQDVTLALGGPLEGLVR
jgi:hypothetical protein